MQVLIEKKTPLGKLFLFPPAFAGKLKFFFFLNSDYLINYKFSDFIRSKSVSLLQNYLTHFVFLKLCVNVFCQDFFPLNLSRIFTTIFDIFSTFLVSQKCLKLSTKFGKKSFPSKKH